MRHSKTVFKWFSVFRYEQEQDYLRKMHNSGWKLTGVRFPGLYNFTECAPEDVVYQLDYNQEGVANKTEYVQMFSDCGWEYLFDFVGYSYFRKPVSQMQGNEEIFCDDESRLDMMKRVYKGRVIPLAVIFFCIIVPQFVSNILGYGGGRMFSNFFGFLFVLYMCLFLAFGLQFYRYKKKVEKQGMQNYKS